MITASRSQLWLLAAAFLLGTFVLPRTALVADDKAKPGEKKAEDKKKDEKKDDKKKDDKAGNTAIKPVPRDAGWMKRHESFLARGKKGDIDVLFLGDSITQGWEGSGKAVWKEHFEPLKSANFGISGDRTEHVIWRMRNGELEGLAPKLVVIMIGTNNGGDSAPDVALGIKTIIADIHERCARAKFLLLGIFPRSEKPDGARAKNDEVNKLISRYAGDLSLGRVSYMDIGPKFLAADGTLPKDVMPDFLHPNEKGYQIWADAIVDKVKQLMVDDSGKPAPSFSPPSPVAKVAHIEETISAGKVDAGIKALEKLTSDKDAKTADAAKAALTVVETWKGQVDTEIARLKDSGDVYLAAEIATGMASV
jgi:beta-glucosidase